MKAGQQLTAGVLRALSSWHSMMQRCFSADCTGFADYGGRGISVCERWLEPWAFIDDMGERGVGFSLGRIDNEGNYEPENCRWETAQQQNSNTRRNVFIDGRTQSETARRLGLSDATVMRRRLAGRQLDVAPHFKRNKLTLDQVHHIKCLLVATRQSNVAIARSFGVSHTLIAQVRRGALWSRVATPDLEQALHTMAKLQMQAAAPTLEWDE